MSASSEFVSVTNPHQLAYHLLKLSFSEVKSELGGAILFTTLSQIAWFFGIHGPNLLDPITHDIYTNSSGYIKGDMLAKYREKVEAEQKKVFKALKALSVICLGDDHATDKDLAKRVIRGESLERYRENENAEQPRSLEAFSAAGVDGDDVTEEDFLKMITLRETA